MAGNWFVVALVTIALLVFILIRNGIIRRRNFVIRAWSDVVAYQRQKVELLPDLERLTKEFMSHEKQLLSGITELRSALARITSESVNVEALSDVMRKTQSLLYGFRAVAEAYPNLKSADVLRDLMADMMKLEENISAAITIFNRDTAEFNTGISVFPNSLVNAISPRAHEYPPFIDGEAESKIEYKFKP